MLKATVDQVVLGAEGSSIAPTLALIIGAGMIAQWIAWRMQIPSIITLLLAGLLLGPVAGVLDPDELLGDTLFPLVSLSVAFILFEGGLDLPPRELRSTGTVVRRLITVGMLITLVVGWFAAREIFDIANEAAFVLGAVLVVTGPTVVGPLLRFVRPTGTTGPILRAEGVLIDPIGAFAALLAFEIVLTDTVDQAALRIAWIAFITIVAGVGIGLAAAFVLDIALQRYLIPDALAVPITLAVVVGAFVASNEVQEESGLLAVTVLGIYLARRESSTIRQVLEFNESLRTMLISALFILLAARIEAEQLRDVALPALAFLAVLVLVARPLSVLVSSVRTSLTWRERVFLMAMAPRGIVAAAVSAIFALRLEQEDVPDASEIVPIVFLVIIGTIVVYGFAAGPVARRLGLAESQADGVLIAGATEVGRGLAVQLRDAGVRTLLIDTDRYNVTRAIAAGLNARLMSALSESAGQDLDLRGIGRLLAFTSNDEANALATARFARLFGRREVFQLAPSAPHSGVSRVPDEHLGRIIGIDEITYRALDDRSRRGWRVRTAGAGTLVQDAYEDNEFIPIVRVIDGRMAFLCHNDALPTSGLVIGMASPDLQLRLDAAEEAAEASNGSEESSAPAEPTGGAIAGSTDTASDGASDGTADASADGATDAGGDGATEAAPDGARSGASTGTSGTSDASTDGASDGATQAETDAEGDAATAVEADGAAQGETGLGGDAATDAASDGAAQGETGLGGDAATDAASDGARSHASAARTGQDRHDR